MPIAQERTYWVSIAASTPRGVPFAGMTSDLARRSWEHRERVMDGFTRRYWVGRLVHFEAHKDAAAAAKRERAMKRWRRDWKIQLIEKEDPTRRDLFGDAVRADGFQW
jgi:putative endonuclease